MSGPALRQRHAHHAIHESAFGEAEELTALLGQLIADKDEVKATQLIPVIIEHWQTRTLVHAAEEEAGLYREVLEARPELESLVIGLKRDHQLLRMMVDDLERLLRTLGRHTAGNNEGLVLTEPLQNWQFLTEAFDKCKTLLYINQIHSETEETALLGM